MSLRRPYAIAHAELHILYGQAFHDEVFIGLFGGSLSLARPVGLCKLPCSERDFAILSNGFQRRL